MPRENKMFSDSCISKYWATHLATAKHKQVYI